ncbi:MAG: ATP-binding protein [Bacteroidota bacterium]|nr:ATP-binding protein [Bacteroidota bacterium]
MTKIIKNTIFRNNPLFTNSLLIALILSIATGLMCGYLYQTSPKNVVSISKFQKELLVKEKLAEKTIEDMNEIITHSSIDSLIHYPFVKNGTSYYVFVKNEMVFWSDNQHDISSGGLPDSADWHFVQLPNAYCISRLITVDSRKLLALIKIKNNYPYENNELNNSFARGFNLDKQVQVVKGNDTDKLAVFGSHGNYLFTLSEPKTPVYNETYAHIGLIAYSLAFLFFFVLYARFPMLIRKKTINLNAFIGLAVGVGILIGFCLYFNLPSLFFRSKLFSPFQYASNTFLASIVHLTMVTGYLLSTIYLFYSYTDTDKFRTITTRIIIQLLYALYFVLVYYLLRGLIYNSSIQLDILQFKDFSGLTIWIHFLLLVWGIGLALLFFKTHSWFKKNQLLKLAYLNDFIFTILMFFICHKISPEDSIRLSVSFVILWMVFYLPFIFPKYKNIYGFVACWVLLFTVFVVWNSLVIGQIKKNDKYKVLAQNISVNGNTENDRMADILLEELDLQIRNNRKLSRLVAKHDSLTAANDYLAKIYQRGFWNKYDMRLNVASVHSDLYKEYQQYIDNVGTQLRNTHFYSIPANENNISYIGVFQSSYVRSDSLFFFMEFYPRRNFKSYSFPNLLIASTPDIQTHLDIAVAKYENQKLVYTSGKVDYPQDINWIPKLKSDYYSFVYKGLTNYVYSPTANTCIVITEQQSHDLQVYLLYFLYVFLAFFSIASLIVWGFLICSRKEQYRLGLTAKFQYAFIALLIISFVGIFYVSVNFIQKKYQEEQIANLENKKGYIQKALQDMYYWNQDLHAINSQTLNLDLQDLSYIYHTDIHVYNNDGVLVGSSQPIIFNKKLISNRIAPAPFFSANSNINQYEHIGQLKYLTGYTDFNNGDFLQIGYIAVPQFYSQDEIKNEIESFLAVIIQIYLIVVVLVILLSLFIGKQLSAPLYMLENKLKEMRLGSRNEKIDYKQNDEIGQLVIQYNRTIDELEQSVKLLAKSERESAWKSMARQVAHEINNPLTPMKLSIQQLRRTKELNDERFDDYFEKSTTMLVEQIDNLSRIAGTFSNFARMPEANFEKVDIASKLFSVVQLFMNNFDHIQIEYNGTESGVFVYADPEQLVQVFNNLLKNAIQAIPDERTGKIQVHLQEIDENVIIEITDNGIGIDSEIQDKLFVPNFTTKTTGMGLGLAIAKNLIELSEGTITFSTIVNEGTTFTLKLPLAV